MTRLKTRDIAGLSSTLAAYDARLRSQTGQSLKGLACLALGIEADQWSVRLADMNVGVVPFSCGQGIIKHFSDTVAGIITHLGGAAFVATPSDVAAIVDACDRHADILFMADEDRFVAMDLQRRRVVDNAEMTGRGFALGLSLMAGGIAGKTVLVIGCGPVGQSAAAQLLALGARLATYDIKRSSVEVLIGKIAGRVKLEPDLDSALVHYDLILDASPAGGIVRAEHIGQKTFVAAPGMPCGATAAAREKLDLRLLHDPLQIGVAIMLAEIVRKNNESV